MTTKRQDRMNIKMSLKDRFDTAMSIARVSCEQTGKPISRKTISRRLNKEKFVTRIPYHKPLISTKNQKVLLATEHSVWTEDQWEKVHFSDETKFNFFGSDDKRFVWRENGKR